MDALEKTVDCLIFALAGLSAGLVITVALSEMGVL